MYHTGDGYNVLKKIEVFLRYLKKKVHYMKSEKKKTSHVSVTFLLILKKWKRLILVKDNFENNILISLMFVIKLYLCIEMTNKAEPIPVLMTNSRID